MHEQFLVNMAQKTGESILSAKLIFHKGLCTMTKAITIVVLPSRFLKRCNLIESQNVGLIVVVFSVIGSMYL